MSKIIKICLVGDKLANFKNNEGVKTFSEFKAYIENAKPKEFSDKKLIVVVGQGISDQKITLMHEIINRRSLNELIQLKKVVDKKCRSSKILTHKHKSENNMISVPEFIDEGIYQSYLMLDDQCDEMNDHVTGQHLQGMILIEAARQMTLAVTEMYFIKEEDRDSVAFVTNSLKTDFYGYIFPCDVILNYKIIECRIGIKVNAKYKILVQFIQNEEVKTEVYYEFSTMEKQFLYEREQTLAKNSIESYLSRYGKAA